MQTDMGILLVSEPVYNMCKLESTFSPAYTKKRANHDFESVVVELLRLTDSK